MKKTLFIILIALMITSCGNNTSNIANETIPSTSPTSTDQELPTLSVITVGTGTPNSSENKVNASTAIGYNGKYYIIDTGNGSYTNLESSDFDFKTIGGIFLTHHHLDHTTDFFNLYAKCVLTGAKDFMVVGPPRTSEFVDFVNTVYLDDFLYRKLNTTKNMSKINKESISDFTTVKEIIGEETFILDDIHITTAEMTHTMYNLAYRFSVDNQSIVVSGDTSFDEDLITLSKGADILVIDGTLFNDSDKASTREHITIEPFYEYGGKFDVVPHLSFDDMVHIANEARVKTLVITHYNEASQRRIDASIIKAKEIFDGSVIYATDMMEIKVQRDQQK